MPASLYQPQDEKKEIWVYLEHNEGVWEDVSLELLGKGRQLVDKLGWSLVGLLLGRDVRNLAHQAVQFGADKVRVANHALLEFFSVDAYVPAAFQAIMDGRPSIFLLGATPNGRDLAARLAVRLRTGLNADCTDLHLNPEGVLISEVSGFGGGVLAHIQMEQHRPQMATVRPGIFAPPEAEPQRTGDILEIPVALTKEMIHTTVLERVIGEGVNLRRAAVIVAGGRGVDGDFPTLQRLADLLGGEVGATRPPVDKGQIERERQIGQTGVVCSPKLAICCGISGAFHFVVGVEKANTVIAINTDPEAPIFDYADYCVVGDVHQIVPALISYLEKAQEVSYA